MENAIEGIGLKMLQNEELDRIITMIVERNKSLIEQRGPNAFGPLIGIVMKEVRGKANPALVNELLKKKLERASKRHLGRKA
jgi:glutamyl-tRNA(Gln) amidotransferase subunit E